MPTLNWESEEECVERYSYTFNPSSTAPLYMELYHFLGQFVGIALRSKITLDLSFPSFIWKLMVSEPLTEEDIKSFDISAGDFICKLGAIYTQWESQSEGVFTSSTGELHHENAVLLQTLESFTCDLTWTLKRSDGVVVELIEGGSTKYVDVKDIRTYLDLYVHNRLIECKHSVEAFRKGFLTIIPENALSLLTWEELQTLVCGSRTIDVSRLRDNTEYDDDINPDDPHVVLFWDVLSEFTEEEKSGYLRFVWARPTLPPPGMDFSQKMRILSAVNSDSKLKPDDYLPKAHTCFFSINLPKYSTKAIMREKLLYAIHNCTEMDADFRTTETDVPGWF